MVIIGFDPGSVSFGLGILEKEGKKISYLYSDEIKLKERNFNSKMKHLWNSINEIFHSFSIDQAAIEEGFLGKNAKTMNILAKVRGVVLASTIHHNVELVSYSPREVKLALTGSGDALKNQVNRMITTLLGIKEKKLGNDESDALAVAYCRALNIK